MMLSSRDVENCEDTPAIMEEKGETKKRGRTYCVAGAPNDVRIIHPHQVFLCVTFQSMSRLWRLWRLRTHTTGQIRGIWPIYSAKKNGYFKSLFPYRTRLFHNLFASEEWWASYCYLFHALEMYTVLSCLGNAVLSFSLQPCSMVPRIT